MRFSQSIIAYMYTKLWPKVPLLIRMIFSVYSSGVYKAQNTQDASVKRHVMHA